MNEDLKVFSAGANNALTKGICDRIDIPLSQLDISRFSNDNLSVQLKESVREKDVFVVQSLTQPASDIRGLYSGFLFCHFHYSTILLLL